MSDNEWQRDFDRAQESKEVNIICMKWGDRYGPEWVNRLYAMMYRNTTWSFRFVCFTDDETGIRKDVECRPLPEDATGRKNLRKLSILGSELADLTGMTLFLDLDVVVMSNVDELFTYEGRFCMMQEWWLDPSSGYGNSSVVRYFIGQESYVLQRFLDTPADEIQAQYNSKDQNVMSRMVENVTFWPRSWCAPFNIVCLPKSRILRFFSSPTPPSDCKILVFYGAITPATALRGEHEQRKQSKPGLLRRLVRRRFGPAHWLADYWKE
ncbi:MAG: hypothetical protein ACR2PG_11710 [Hyphomicrobiaceae bacterium]